MLLNSKNLKKEMEGKYPSIPITDGVGNVRDS